MAVKHERFLQTDPEAAVQWVRCVGGWSVQMLTCEHFMIFGTQGEINTLGGIFRQSTLTLP